MSYALPLFVSLILLLTLAQTLTHAQSFQYRADLAPVATSGYHRIVLPPAVVGRLNNELGDIRLYDDQDREVPYVLNRANVGQSRQFESYPIVSRTSIPEKSTTLVVQPPGRMTIQQLTLLVKNTSISKPVRLSGSNDKQQWFGIADDLAIEPSDQTTSTSAVKRLYFPLSDYVYYRIELSDSLTAPLNILQIGRYKTSTSMAGYTPIDGLTIQQTDTKATAQTNIRLTFSESAHVDKLAIQVAQPTQYRRDAELSVYHERTVGQRQSKQSLINIRTFTLSSVDSNVLVLPSIQTRELRLTIHNKDNLPLVIGRVQAYQLTTYLTANLTASTSYHLLFSSLAIDTPRYDLASFKASIPVNAPEIGIDKIGTFGLHGVYKNSFWSSRWLIWPALGLALAVLGWLSYRMVREMD